MTKILKFMPRFGLELTTGRKTLTFRKATKYDWLKPDDLVDLVLDTCPDYVVGRARIMGVGLGHLSLKPLPASRPMPENHFRMGLYWTDEYKEHPLTYIEIEADGFGLDPQAFVETHRALGNLSLYAKHPIVLRRIEFRLENKPKAERDYAEYIRQQCSHELPF